ncbi:glycosyltransferase (plasmid) [Lactiplantibacillus plantarum]|uniref:glycosyltransferase n=1 Tax=Lactobacillaceae TaxID=33958 RepID=UPI000F77FA68|nr:MULTISPECIES: glycosyltransferase [Lactobacillaceae]QBA72868.1 glycosyltransferase [Lactiplantibacillus plantarum]
MKMNVELLISTMNLKDPDELKVREGVSGKSVIINQITKDDSSDFEIKEGENRCFSYTEKGLSRSRNHAIEKAIGDICTLSDDDMTYRKNYKEIIEKAYRKYTDADIIAFSFIYPDGKERHHLRPGRVKPLWTLKLNSAMLTYKRESIVKNNLKFDERFGAGSEIPWGEENIFLLDCVRKGLKIYYIPIVIGKLQPGESSWDRHGTPEHCRQQGALYYRMSSKYYWLLILHFCFFRRYCYIEDSSTRTALRCMFEGARMFKKEEKIQK